MAKPTKSRKAHKGNPASGKPQKEQKHPDQWNRNPNPDRVAGENIDGAPSRSDRHARTAADIEALTEKLTDFTRDELAKIPIVSVGTKLKQGAVYLDLRSPAPVPFTATGENIAQEVNYFTPRAEIRYEIWNRLVNKLEPARLRSETPRDSEENRPFSPERAKAEAAAEQERSSESSGTASTAEVDEATAESFPASDPPSWTTGRDKKTKGSDARRDDPNEPTDKE
jgi:hypothetical protein